MLRDALKIAPGTPNDLQQAAQLGARIAARKWRGEGFDDETVRRRVIDQYGRDFVDDGYGDYEQETLMSAVLRGLDEALD